MHPFFACNFFASKSFNSFEISVKFCVVLIPLLKFCEEKVFRSYYHFFETFLKPNSQETARNFEKRVSQKCLKRITFYPYIPVKPYHFITKIIIAVPYFTDYTKSPEATFSQRENVLLVPPWELVVQPGILPGLVLALRRWSWP